MGVRPPPEVAGRSSARLRARLDAPPTKPRERHSARRASSATRSMRRRAARAPAGARATRTSRPNSRCGRLRAGAGARSRPQAAFDRRRGTRQRPRAPPELPGATRTSRSNSPTPTSRAPRPRWRALRGRAAAPRRARRRAPRRGLAPTQPCRRLRPLPKPRSSTGKATSRALAALAAAATDPAERSALEWASLRADAHPSFASLAAFLEAHPNWPSRGWIREQQEADLAAHPQAPAKVAAFFAGDPPQSSAGKIAAARAAQAMGRAEEATQIIRALWRDGNFDALAESVILREFGASLTKADHAYRADRLLYAGYLSAGVRAAALAGPDVLALAQARIEAARAPVSSARYQGGSAGAPQRSRSPVLQDPVRPPRGPGLRGGGPPEPRAARSRRARQPGSMVERAEDGRPHAARPRRAATCV